MAECQHELEAWSASKEQLIVHGKLFQDADAEWAIHALTNTLSESNLLAVVKSQVLVMSDLYQELFLLAATNHEKARLYVECLFDAFN